jgi:hypothetical protein
MFHKVHIFPSNARAVLGHFAVLALAITSRRKICLDGPVIYSRFVSTKISFATARLDDAAAMAKFLIGIPNGEELGKVLQNKEAVSSRAYDDETWTARFVVSDGQVVKCFAVTDITIDQAEMIAAACIDIPALDEAGFREVVAQSLGPTIDALE